MRTNALFWIQLALSVWTHQVGSILMVAKQLLSLGPDRQILKVWLWPSVLLSSALFAAWAACGMQPLHGAFAAKSRQNLAFLLSYMLPNDNFMLHPWAHSIWKHMMTYQISIKLLHRADNHLAVTVVLRTKTLTTMYRF